MTTKAPSKNGSTKSVAASLKPVETKTTSKSSSVKDDAAKASGAKTATQPPASQTKQAAVSGNVKPTSTSNRKEDKAMAKTKTAAKSSKKTSSKKKSEVTPIDKVLDDNETLKTAVQQIEAQFGSGSIMALGNDTKQKILSLIHI